MYMIYMYLIHKFLNIFMNGYTYKMESSIPKKNCVAIKLKFKHTLNLKIQIAVLIKMTQLDVIRSTR